MDVDLHAANSLPARADELFRIFARFEFALKMAGFAKMKHSCVDIRWDDMAECPKLGLPFWNHVCEHEICPNILTNPPQKEVIENNIYQFKDENKPTDAKGLFIMVRRVRNNLFHGGKYFDDNGDRNDALVSEAISILLLALEWHDGIRHYFEGKA